jgi:formate/nitrite transporter
MDEAPHSTDAHPPHKIARMVEHLGVAKAQSDTVKLLALSVLGGAFISLGSILFTVVMTGAGFGFGVSRLIGGMCFCLGLILVVVAGAELFTGNVLLSVAWASRMIGTPAILRNWVLSYLGNVLGCLGTVLFVAWARIDILGGGAVGKMAIDIARAKADLTFGEAFARGVLCNALVCLAIWMALGGRSVTDKILGILFPITAFVTMGLEHSIANWFFLPYGLALDKQGAVSAVGAACNLAAVSLGNIVGGTVLVAAVYWVAYLRGGPRNDRPPS